jgi:hypothetical protein
MDNSTKANISRLVSYLDNFNPENVDNNTIRDINQLNNHMYMDNSANAILLKDLRQTHTKLAVLETPKLGVEKIQYKTNLDLNKLDNVIDSNLWKNAPDTNSLFDSYENKKNNLVKMENPKKGQFKPIDDDEDEIRPVKKKNNGFYMENNNLKRKK